MDATVSRTESRQLPREASILVVAAEIAVFFMGSTLLTPLYVLYKRAFGFSEITLTLIYAVYVIGNLAALLLLGRLSDRIGRRPMSFAAFAAAALSTLLFLIAEGTALLFVARALNGLAVGLASGTGTAWLADFHGKDDQPRATVFAATANMVGISLGPVVAGVLAQYAPAPLRLSFLVYLLAIAVVAFLVWRTPETVRRKADGVGSVMPRIGVPRNIRAAFLGPAITVFASFALIGFYAALIPSVLNESLHITNSAVGGLVAFEMFIVAAATIVISRQLPSRTAMMSGLGLFVPGLCLLVLSQTFGSIGLLLAGTALGGVAAALSYRGSLQVVNEIAPPEGRGEVVSAYYAVGFAGNSIPVIGVGVLSSLAGYQAASVAFAVLLAVLAFAALFAGRRFTAKG